MKILLGVDIDFLHTLPSNSMSQKYIVTNGHNLSYSSSGFRLIATLITSLLDEDYATFLVDEPELGISPEAQGILADFLFDREHRRQYFPHLKTLILATHSTIFLDRRRLQNNYTVEKTGDIIRVVAVDTQAAFNRIHFFLLGNRFETLFLPSLIVIVEGKSDYAFIQKVLMVKYGGVQFSVINATSDGRIREVIHMAKSLLSDIQRSPYRDRMLVILDSVHERSLVESLISMGLPRENIIIWSANGVEYLYPPKILNSIFGEGGSLTIKGDVVTRNELSFSKAELCDQVVARLGPDTEMAEEFQTKFLSTVSQRLG